MTKMAAMLICGKKPSKIFSYRIISSTIMKLGMEQYVLKLYKVYIKDDTELTLTHFKTLSILVNLFLYLQLQISGERLQDYWSSGFSFVSFLPLLFLCVFFIKNRRFYYRLFCRTR